MKSGSWSSYVAAGAMGADYGVPDDDEPARPIGEVPCRLEMLQERGYRAYRDALSGGRWIVAMWDKTLDVPIGVAIGGGATAAEAWDAALRWEADEWTRIHRELDEYTV